MKRSYVLPAASFSSALMAVALVCATASAQPIEVPAASAEPGREPSPAFWQAQIGARTTFVTDAGFDLFAADNALVQLSVAASRTLLVWERFSFAPGLSWDFGARSSTIRGDPSSLASHRLAVQLEGRYHLLPWLYGLVRVCPGAAHQSVEVQDSLAPAALRDTQWAPSADFSLGGAVLLGPQWSRSASAVRFWAQAEGGYGWAGRQHLVLSPDLASDDTRRVGTLDLGDLALRGGFFRIAVFTTL